MRRQDKEQVTWQRLGRPRAGLRCGGQFIDATARPALGQEDQRFFDAKVPEVTATDYDGEHQSDPHRMEPRAMGLAQRLTYKQSSDRPMCQVEGVRRIAHPTEPTRRLESTASF